MVVFEILIYIFFAFVMYNYAKKSYAYSLKYQKTEKPNTGLWLFWLFFALICGIRWNVGADSVGYMIDFRDGRIDNDSGEHLWNILVLSVHKLHLHYTIGMAITGFVQIYFVTKQASKYRFILIFLPIVLFGGGHFLGWCNAVRQMMAASIFVYSTQYILQKKLIPYLLCIFVASQIHHSAQLLYVMYVFAYIRPDKISISDKKVMTTVIFIVCFVLGMTTQFQNFLGIFSFLVESLGTYDYVDNVIHKTIVEGETTARNFGPMQFSYFLTSLAPIWYGSELKREFKERIPYFDLWWFFFYIYACGYFLVCNIDYMFIRPFHYFQPFQLLITSLLLYYFYSRKSRSLFWGFTGIIWVSLAWNIIKNMGNPMESVTYKLFFFHSIEEFYNLFQHAIQ